MGAISGCSPKCIIQSTVEVSREVGSEMDCPQVNALLYSCPLHRGIMAIGLSNHDIKKYMHLFQPFSAMCLQFRHWLDAEYGKT